MRRKRTEIGGKGEVKKKQKTGRGRKQRRRRNDGGGGNRIWPEEVNVY